MLNLYCAKMVFCYTQMLSLTYGYLYLIFASPLILMLKNYKYGLGQSLISCGSSKIDGFCKSEYKRDLNSER